MTATVKTKAVYIRIQTPKDLHSVPFPPTVYSRSRCAGNWCHHTEPVEAQDPWDFDGGGGTPLPHPDVTEVTFSYKNLPRSIPVPGETHRTRRREVRLRTGRRRRNEQGPPKHQDRGPPDDEGVEDNGGEGVRPEGGVGW